MRVSRLEDRESFALLGPGFGGGRWLLLDSLRPCERPALVLADFETPGAAARRLAAATTRAIRPEMDAPLLAPDHPVRLDVRGYARAVGRVRRAIARGEVYQVCLARMADVGAACGASLLASLCVAGTPRFAAWVRLPGGLEVVSASPELFFATDGRRVRTEPMKGTARVDARGTLATSEKDRSELAMITDLLRNDLTPVCRPRSVRVRCERRVLELPYALQCVSEIEGKLDDGVTALDVLAALHPGGSVTGAPKRAALDMIAELEPGARGAYCGALGLCQGDRAIFSMLIRTAQRRGEGWVYGVGSGIVWDSVAAAELAELRLKLGALGGGVHPPAALQLGRDCPQPPGPTGRKEKMNK